MGSIFFISSFFTSPVDPFSDTRPNKAPTSTTEPSFELISVKTPFIGAYLAIFNAARFSKTLALLTASQVPIVDAFKGAQAVVGNVYLRQHIKAAGVSIREGSSIFQALKERPILPPIALHLVASGETSGRLAQMLDKAADQLDTQLQRSISVALSLIEPLMMLVMGGLVLVIVMAILLPIFDLDDTNNIADFILKTVRLL